MGTTNERLLAEAAVNLKNYAVKRMGVQISNLATTINDFCSSDGTEEGTPDSTIAAAAAEIGAQVLAMDNRADVLFPVVKGDGVDAPAMTSAVVGDTPTEITVTYNGDITVTDETGFTISGSTLATSISGVAAAGNEIVLTANDAVANGEDVTISYDGDTGNVVSTVDGDAAVDNTDYPVENNVAA